MTLTFQGHVTSAAIRFAIGHFLLVIRLATIHMLPTDDRRQTDGPLLRSANKTDKQLDRKIIH